MTDTLKPPASLDLPSFRQLLGGPLPPSDKLPETIQRHLTWLLHLSQQVPSSKTELLDVERAKHLTLVEFLSSLPQAEPPQEPDVRALFLAKRATQLPATLFRQRLLEQIWAEHTTLHPTMRARLAFLIVPLLPVKQPALRPALARLYRIVQTLDNKESLSRSLIALVPYFSADAQPQIQQSILKQIRRIPVERHRAHTLVSLATVLDPSIAYAALQEAGKIKDPAAQAQALAAIAESLPLDMIGRVQRHIIRSISQIRLESERVEVLIQFAPRIDRQAAPDVLAAAHKIASGFSNPGPLIALAPHLDHDALKAVVARVDAYPDESKRAAFYAMLVPDLPLSLLQRVYKTTLDLTTPATRAEALSALSLHLPADDQAEIRAMAIEAAQAITNPFERVVALHRFLGQTTDREASLRVCLEAIQEIHNEASQMRALGMIAPYLTEAFTTVALELAYAFQVPQNRLSALSNLLPSLPADARTVHLQHALNIINGFQFDFRRTRALIQIADMLPPDMVPPALQIARAIHEPYDRLSGILALAAQVPIAERPPLLGEIWQLSKRVTNGYDQASAFINLAPFLPETAYDDLIDALCAAISAILDEYDQASAIVMSTPVLDIIQHRRRFVLDRQSVLGVGLLACVQDGLTQPALFIEGAGQWANLPDPGARWNIWQVLLPEIARLPLSKTFACLQAMQPVIQQFGGEAAIQAAVHVVKTQET